jgi:hypothetical protein
MALLLSTFAVKSIYSLNFYLSVDFLRILILLVWISVYLSGGFLVNEPMIPVRIAIIRGGLLAHAWASYSRPNFHSSCWIPCLWAGDSLRKNRFLHWIPTTWQKNSLLSILPRTVISVVIWAGVLRMVDRSRIRNSKGALPPKSIF